MLNTRKMTPLDVTRVHAIESASFQTPWSEEAFHKELTENTLAVYLVLELDDEIIGFGGMWLIMDEIHITNIAIAPEYRRKGYGEKLVEAMVNYGVENGFKHMTLEVRVSNAPAIALYEKYGFKGFGIRPKYYIDTGEDALVMWKEL